MTTEPTFVILDGARLPSEKMDSEQTFVMKKKEDLPGDQNTLRVLRESRPVYVGKNNETYRPQEKLGGICGSYLAVDSADRTVFLKAFDNDAFDENTMRDIYGREIRAATALAPLGITLPVQDTGREDLFLVHEFVYGRSLDDLITMIDRPIKPDGAKRIMLALLKAVKLAHKHGYTHRDLKPENILYRSDDINLEHPLIVDWGLSCVETERQFIDHHVGTKIYAAPEQYRSFGIADERTDIYSLGIILYRLLTCKLPFEQTLPMEEIARQQEEGALNPKIKHPAVNSRLSLITLKMTQPEKRDRHQCIDEVMEDLKAPELVAVR